MTLRSPRALRLISRPEEAKIHSPSPGTSCHLCGLPVRQTGAVQVAEGETLHFCCPGCRQVFLILSSRPEGAPVDFRDTDLYRACVEAGIIPRNEADAVSGENAGEEPEDMGPTPSRDAGPDRSLALDLTLRIEGMWCPSCSWVIEHVLSKTAGVIESKVHFVSDLAQIRYLAYRTAPREILQEIAKLGYRPALLENRTEKSKEMKALFTRMGISAILTLNIMMISFALYFGFLEELGQEAIRMLSFPLWILSSVVIFYGGWAILHRAFAGLRHGFFSMEMLISAGALGAYFYSILRMAQGSLHLYFDTASMLVTLVLVGKVLETKAKGKVSQGITDLYDLARQKVRLCLVAENGVVREQWVSAAAVAAGDEFVVKADERPALDGEILSGIADVDESILTGEARPVRKRPGDPVMSGVLLLTGELRLKATRVGPQTSVGQMITLIQEALSRKNPFELLADRIMRWFVPGILGIAAATGAFLLFSGAFLEEAVLRSLTVLVISCPCALGIATPIAKVAALAKGRSLGILIRDPGALERTPDLQILIFDKTGTLTEGKFQLQEMVCEKGPPEEALSRLAAVEIHSGHFLGRAVVRRARETLPRVERASAFQEFPGMGAKGFLHGDEIFAGNRKFLDHLRLDLPAPLHEKALQLEGKGKTLVFFGWGRQVQGFLVFGDDLKADVKALMKDLHSRKISTWLVSGDSCESTRAVAEEAGVPFFQGQALPWDKVELIKNFQEKGCRVGMVGDGLNDAAALARADVGFALGPTADLLREASDFTLLGNETGKVIEALGLSARAMKVVKQNLFFAFFYNGLGIPLAMAGLLNPLVAVLAMFASSLTVIGNALRIQAGKRKEKPGKETPAVDVRGARRGGRPK